MDFLSFASFVIFFVAQRIIVSNQRADCLLGGMIEPGQFFQLLSNVL